MSVSVRAHHRRHPGSPFLRSTAILDPVAEVNRLLAEPDVLDELVPPGQPWAAQVRQLARLVAGGRAEEAIEVEARDRLAGLLGCGRGTDLRGALRAAFGSDPVEAAGVVEHRLRAAGATDEAISDTTRALRSLATTKNEGDAHAAT